MDKLVYLPLAHIPHHAQQLSARVFCGLRIPLFEHERVPFVDIKIIEAQFESFLDPFIIMLTVPLALAGALLSLYLFNQTLNIFSEIGMIMLIGLVTKNGILIVEFANQKRKFGLPKREAVIEAAAQRLRPILMTSLATSLGALPIALSLGAAATSRIPLGIVVVGGILFSLFLTLLVIPAVYTFISGKHKVSEVVITE